eukprot:1853215-Rhodomonas_salina.2
MSVAGSYSISRHPSGHGADVATMYCNLVTAIAEHGPATCRLVAQISTLLPTLHAFSTYPGNEYILASCIKSLYCFAREKAVGSDEFCVDKLRETEAGLFLLSTFMKELGSAVEQADLTEDIRELGNEVLCAFETAH